MLYGTTSKGVNGVEKNRENGIGVWYIGEDWVAATTVEEAKSYYFDVECFDEEDAEDMEVTEVDNLDANEIIDVQAYENGEDKRISYRDLIKWYVERGGIEQFPTVIATENW
jgi:hypothetical protein